MRPLVWRNKPRFPLLAISPHIRELVRTNKPATLAGCPAVFVADHLRPAALKAGVQIPDGHRFGLHNMRHSLSHWLVNQAKVEPKTVQTILRHSRIQTTLDIYTQGDGDETPAVQGAFLKELGMASEMIRVRAGLWVELWVGLAGLNSPQALRKEMVGAIGFEPSAFKQAEVLAGLGWWQLKDRNGSQRNNYWTRIGHSLWGEPLRWHKLFGHSFPRLYPCLRFTDSLALSAQDSGPRGSPVLSRKNFAFSGDFTSTTSPHWSRANEPRNDATGLMLLELRPGQASFLSAWPVRELLLVFVLVFVLLPQRAIGVHILNVDRVIADAVVRPRYRRQA
jgi:hypothetical protein